MQQTHSVSANIAGQAAISGQSRHKIEELDFPFCPEATKYEKLAKIGQGTFGYKLFLL
jgi:hypothetical protein